MALWDVYQTTTRLDTGQQFGPDFIKAIDDAQPINPQLEQNFGPERNSVQYTSPQDGVIEAKIQYSPQNAQGWVRDNSVNYQYIVIFRAVRQSVF
jgi:hypothetical protein